MEEISETLSMSVEEEEVETEPDFSISFLRTNDFPWIFTKKPEKTSEQPPEEESEDSSVVENDEVELYDTLSSLVCIYKSDELNIFSEITSEIRRLMTKTVALADGV